MTIKAIETRYKGYRFRSRLEARWAVFFDALGLEWEYEPEGFDLGEAGWYLPDFYLPQLDAWIEIKPKNGDREEVFIQLVSMIDGGPAEQGKAWGFFGDPFDHEWLMPVYRNDDKGTGWRSEWANAAIEFHLIEGEWEAWPGFCYGNVPSEFLKSLDRYRLIENLEERTKARSARFEHGERG